MRKKFLYSKIFLLASFLIIFSFFWILEAKALELVWPAPPGGKSLNALESEGNLSIAALVEYFYRWGIALGGIMVFFALVMAGFQYLASVGDPAKMRDAKNRITSALLGLVLLLSSFLILNVINPELTTLGIPDLTLVTSTLQAIDVDSFQVSKPCEKAFVYSEANQEGNSLEVGPGQESGNLTLSPPSGIGGVARSVEIKGFCRLDLYSTTNCGGEPMTFVTSNYSDFDGLYLNDDVRCVSNAAASTVGSTCNTDCTECGDSTTCEASPADCNWCGCWCSFDPDYLYWDCWEDEIEENCVPGFGYMCTWIGCSAR